MVLHCKWTTTSGSRTFIVHTSVVVPSCKFARVHSKPVCGFVSGCSQLISSQQEDSVSSKRGHKLMTRRRKGLSLGNVTKKYSCENRMDWCAARRVLHQFALSDSWLMGHTADSNWSMCPFVVSEWRKSTGTNGTSTWEKSMRIPAAAIMSSSLNQTPPQTEEQNVDLQHTLQVCGLGNWKAAYLSPSEEWFTFSNTFYFFHREELERLVHREWSTTADIWDESSEHCSSLKTQQRVNVAAQPDRPEQWRIQTYSVQFQFPRTPLYCNWRTVEHRWILNAVFSAKRHGDDCWYWFNWLTMM